MASFTVRIFSASSSGISISKASSKAITSSTVSSESAPRSSTNEAFGVTSPSSTPSCSTIICFTFSSTAAMFLLAYSYMPRRHTCLGIWLLTHLGMLLDVVKSILHGAEFLCIFIRNLNAKSLFQCHHQLNLVQRIGAKIVHKRSAGRDFAFIHSQLFGDDLLHLFHRIFLFISHINPPPENFKGMS